MRRSATIVCSLPFLLMIQGCSTHLSRHEASSKIDALIKAQPVGENKFEIRTGAPTFGLPSSEFNDEAVEIGHVGINPDSPGTYDLEWNALAKLGYLTIKDAGPGYIVTYSGIKHYDSTRLVDLTPKVGKIVEKTKRNETYETGFVCFQMPNPTMCELPDFIDKGTEIEITGVTEEGVHAKVNALFHWKLSKFALEMKPFARPTGGELDNHFQLDPWEEFLGHHQSSGSTQATILFQKFDDGWRIVDEDGKSEKDFER